VTGGGWSERENSVCIYLSPHNSLLYKEVSQTVGLEVKAYFSGLRVWDNNNWVERKKGLPWKHFWRRSILFFFEKMG